MAEVEPPAPVRVEPPARVERKPVDLAATRQRLSEIVYRGLGPNGETHIMKIEKCKSSADLQKIGTTCRDLLKELGKADLASQIGSEIEALSGA